MLPRNQGKYSHCPKYLGTLWQYRYSSTAYGSLGSCNMQNLGSFGSAITGRMVIIYCFAAKEPRQSKHYLKFLGYYILCQYKWSSMAHGNIGSGYTYLGSLGCANTDWIVTIYCCTVQGTKASESKAPWLLYTLSI